MSTCKVPRSKQNHGNACADNFFHSFCYPRDIHEWNEYDLLGIINLAFYGITMKLLFCSLFVCPLSVRAVSKSLKSIWVKKYLKSGEKTTTTSAPTVIAIHYRSLVLSATNFTVSVTRCPFPFSLPYFSALPHLRQGYSFMCGCICWQNSDANTDAIVCAINDTKQRRHFACFFDLDPLYGYILTSYNVLVIPFMVFR